MLRPRLAQLVPRRTDLAVLLPALGALLVGAALGVAGPARAASREDVQSRAKTLFGVLPQEATSAANPLTPAKIDLGRRLYYDERMSVSQTISCNTCHPLDRYGVDHEPTSTGHDGQHGARNAPTVYNAAFEFRQFWDGRAADVEEQAKGPVLNPVEMAMPSPAYVLKVLKSIPGYPELFAKAFPGEKDSVTYDNFGKAIGAFERKLVTPSRFDQFVGGKLDALTDAEVDGLDKFISTGCPACHMTATVGGQMYQKIGLVHPYQTTDLGRYDVTKQEADKYVFKVPSLRNVAQTAPYLSQGKVATLDEAIRLMAWHQLGKKIDDADVQSIKTFLGSLTGEVDQRYIAKPEPLPSGPHTPRPDQGKSAGGGSS